MDRTMVDMCAFVGGSTKLGMTPGGGGPDGVLVRSMVVKSMADTADSYVSCAVNLKTRQERVSRYQEARDVLSLHLRQSNTR
jgi:hypothetical protein